MSERDEVISRLFHEEYENLFRKAYRLSGSTQMANDLVQETFLLALIRYDELTEHPNPRAWLSTVLFNYSMNERRLWENSHSISLEQLGDVFQAEESEIFEEILPEKLSDDEKRLLILRYKHKMNSRELGTFLGISEGAVRARLARLLKKTRKYFDFPEENQKDT